jgi:hypothetical protein
MYFHFHSSNHSEEHYETVRTLTLGHLECNAKLYRPMVLKQNDEIDSEESASRIYETYCKDKASTHGDDVTLQAAADRFQLSVTIIEEDGSTRDFKGSGKCLRTVFLLRSGTKHFDSVQPQEDDNFNAEEAEDDSDAEEAENDVDLDSEADDVVDHGNSDEEDEEEDGCQVPNLVRARQCLRFLRVSVPEFKLKHGKLREQYLKGIKTQEHKDFEDWIRSKDWAAPGLAEHIVRILWERCPRKRDPDLMCNALKLFVEKHGRLPSAGQNADYYFLDGKYLPVGQWLHQRRSYESKQSALNPELKAKIETAVGPQLAATIWSLRKVNRASKEMMCDALFAFSQANDRLPTQYEDWEIDGNVLHVGNWLFNRRLMHARKHLDLETKALIESKIGSKFAADVWDVRSVRRHSFKFMCKALGAFIKARLRMPKQGERFTYKDEDVGLGTWILSIRRRVLIEAYASSDAMPDRAKMLMEASQPFEKDLWTLKTLTRRPKEIWLRAMRQVVIKEQRLPRKTETVFIDGIEIPVGGWFSGQRQKWKNGTLGEDMQTALEECVGPALLEQLWDISPAPPTFPPETYCAALAAFVNEKGTLPPSHERYLYNGLDLGLGNWLSTIRTKSRSGMLCSALESVIEHVVGPKHATGLWDRKQRSSQAFDTKFVDALNEFVECNDSLPALGESWEYDGKEWDLAEGIGSTLHCRCLALAEFIKTSGRIPIRHENIEFDGKKMNIGVFVHSMRSDYRGYGKRITNGLPPLVIAAVEAAVGTEFVVKLWKKARELTIVADDVALKELAAFVKENGQLPPDGCYRVISDGVRFNLGGWLSYRRSCSWNSRRTLDEDLKTGIEHAVGPALAAIIWMKQHTPIYRTPDEVCAMLKKFVSERDKIPTSGDYVEYHGENIDIGGLLATRRRQQRDGVLDNGMKAQLEEAVGARLKDTIWKKMRNPNRAPSAVWCEVLKDYVGARGCWPSPGEVWEYKGKEYKIGNWVANRRNDYRKKRLSEELKRDIEDALGSELAKRFWEKQREVTRRPFTFMCPALEEYVKIHGKMPGEQKKGCIFRFQEVDLPVDTLAVWFRERRDKELAGKLKPEHKEAIDNAVGPELSKTIWTKRAVRFYDELTVKVPATIEFFKRNGRLPKNKETLDVYEHEGETLENLPVGVWLITTWRKQMKANSISEEVVTRLEAAAEQYVVPGGKDALWDGGRKRKRDA